MIIDIHTHAFPGKIAAQAIKTLSGNSHTVPFTDGTTEGLLTSQQKAGIALSVVLPVATAPRQVEHINDSAQHLNSLYAPQIPGKSHLLSFAAMHPELENWEAELHRIASMGLPGIKIHPIYQGVDLDDPRFLRIFRLCGKLGLAVITHTGYDIGYPGVVRCSPEMARRALDQAGPFTFILAHMGGWREWEKVVPLLAGSGAFLDTSFSTGQFTPLPDGYYKSPEECRMLDTSAFTDLCRGFGTDHILFGTDSPWSDQSETLSFIRNCPFTDDELDQILGKNAAGILFPG